MMIESRGIPRSATPGLEQHAQYARGAIGPRVPREDAGGGVTNPLALAGIEEQRAQGVFDQRRVRTGHVPRRVATDLARDRRVQQQARESRGERLERRQPEPFVLRQEDECSAGRIQRLQLFVGDVRPEVNPIAEAGRMNNGREIDMRRGPIVADDLEANVRTGASESAEALDELRNMTAIEDGADEEHCAPME